MNEKDTAVQEVVKRAFIRGAVIHLVDGPDDAVDALVEETVSDRELLTVECDSNIIAEVILTVSVPDDTDRPCSAVEYGDRARSGLRQSR